MSSARDAASALSASAVGARAGPTRDTAGATPGGASGPRSVSLMDATAPGTSLALWTARRYSRGPSAAARSSAPDSRPRSTQISPMASRARPGSWTPSRSLVEGSTERFAQPEVSNPVPPSHAPAHTAPMREATVAARTLVIVDDSSIRVPLPAVERPGTMSRDDGSRLAQGPCRWGNLACYQEWCPGTGRMHESPARSRALDWASSSPHPQAVAGGARGDSRLRGRPLEPPSTCRPCRRRLRRQASAWRSHPRAGRPPPPRW